MQNISAFSLHQTKLLSVARSFLIMINSLRLRMVYTAVTYCMPQVSLCRKSAGLAQNECNYESSILCSAS